MKLIIKEYLCSLREREELDAILPDLLSQMGLNVYSRPGRGTRQDGVDVGAVGSLDGGAEKVYLFTIKAGDITRATWDGGIQSVRPSLNEILDAYLLTRLPNEHREKDIVICICCGGDIQEPVRPAMKGFIDKNSTGKISFEEWNGDKLASLIQESFLRDDLLPKNARSHLRKSLALLDEPDAAYQHFAALLRLLSGVDGIDDQKRKTIVRQIGICLWIQFAWARGAGNLEAAYRSSELALLYAWHLIAPDVGKDNKAARTIIIAFFSIFEVYQQICTEFICTNILPHANKLHALSGAVRGSNSLDVNLKLFDLVGRVAMDGIWAHWVAMRTADSEPQREAMLEKVQRHASTVTAIVANNPALFSPIKDDHCIDISIALLLLASEERNRPDIVGWLAELLRRAKFAYAVHGSYPCNLSSYTDLLTHPTKKDEEYRKSVTGGSVLYPVIALWASLLNDDKVYSDMGKFKRECLGHCNFQLWYPDSESEKHLYRNDGIHGGVLSNIPVELPKESLLGRIFRECDETPHFRELSAAKYGWWPLVVVACRHHRLPLPPHLFAGLYQPIAVRSDKVADA